MQIKVRLAIKAVCKDSHDGRVAPLPFVAYAKHAFVLDGTLLSVGSEGIDRAGPGRAGPEQLRPGLVDGYTS